MKSLLLLFALIGLSGCGSVQALKPAPGAALPPKSAAARTQPTPDELMTPDSQARPQRTDESLRKSETRQPDPFDLPPTS